jgi:hypothetical protein
LEAENPFGLVCNSDCKLSPFTALIKKGQNQGL